jgi:hypothetical protein
MKRIVRISLCALLLLAGSYSTPMVRTSAGSPAQPDLDTAADEVASTAPEQEESAFTPAEAEMETWATRYPREYRDWRQSVHGRARLSGDTAAPGCTDCHDDPDTAEIRTAAFRLDIPSRCARCHDDAQLMRKHDITTDLYPSYLADYHGLTIDYYRTHDPAMWRYEAVCSDCHNSHAIHEAGDPRSSVAPANLLGTCQRCHPEAEANFASITTGHFRIDLESSPLAYYIELIYRILIPTIIGLMAAYIGLDIIHRLRKRLAGTK